jgi:two-component system, LytTR family, response regulator
MINTLIIDADCGTLETLAQHLATYCPQVDVNGAAQTHKEAGRLLHDLQPELVFIDLNMVANSGHPVFDPANAAFETILLHDDWELNSDTFAFPASACLNKPVTIRDLILVVRQAEHWLLWKREMQQSRQLLEQLSCQCAPNQLIGIPTLEGLEFVPAREIIRCEGMQRLTKVFTAENKAIISAYNIGEFGKILEPYGFFSPHKSHLVNLQYLKNYRTDGTLVMCDGSMVPVARRRKDQFLERVRHL